MHKSGIALRLNQRPRKTLGFETPADKLRAVRTHCLGHSLSLVGELGFLSPDNRRTQTVEWFRMAKS
jgi:hypothetical protein